MNKNQKTTKSYKKLLFKIIKILKKIFKRVHLNKLIIIHLKIIIIIKINNHLIKKHQKIKNKSKILMILIKFKIVNYKNKLNNNNKIKILVIKKQRFKQFKKINSIIIKFNNIKITFFQVKKFIKK